MSSENMAAGLLISLYEQEKRPFIDEAMKGPAHALSNIY
jgi:hypothetical protein